MDNTDYENADGGVLNYEVANGLQNIGSDFNENGLPINGMSFAEGNDNANIEDDFFNADGDDEFFNAGGVFGNFRKNQKKRQDRKDLRTKSKSDLRASKGQAKITKADAKVGLADAQKLSAQASEKGVEGDVALAKALEEKGGLKGMSTGAKVGIAIGVAVVLGVIGFVIYKKYKK